MIRYGWFISRQITLQDLTSLHAKISLSLGAYQHVNENLIHTLCSLLLTSWGDSTFQIRDTIVNILDMISSIRGLKEKMCYYNIQDKLAQALTYTNINLNHKIIKILQRLGCEMSYSERYTQVIGWWCMVRNKNYIHFIIQFLYESLTYKLCVFLNKIPQLDNLCEYFAQSYVEMNQDEIYHFAVIVKAIMSNIHIPWQIKYKILKICFQCNGIFYWSETEPLLCKKLLQSVSSVNPIPTRMNREEQLYISSTIFGQLVPFFRLEHEEIVKGCIACSANLLKLPWTEVGITKIVHKWIDNNVIPLLWTRAIETLDVLYYLYGFDCSLLFSQITAKNYDKILVDVILKTQDERALFIFARCATNIEGGFEKLLCMKGLHTAELREIYTNFYIKKTLSYCLNSKDKFIQNLASGMLFGFSFK